MPPTALVEGAMAAALAEHRDRLNAVVAQATRTHVDFDAATLEHQLRGPLRELVEACDRVAPASGARVLAALFDAVVDLVAQHRLGGGTHDALLASLSGLARLLVDEPRRVFGSLANAIVHLHGHGVPVDEWLTRVQATAPLGDSTSALRAGQVAAWSLGLSHLRDGALVVAEALPDDALAAALGIDRSMSPADVLGHLGDDRWWRPGRTKPAGPTVAHRVGGFRGFGGPFLHPPEVGTRDGCIVIRAGPDAWHLHADGWGATLTRTDADGVALQPPAEVPTPPGLAAVTAAAVTEVAAITIATSYQVLVVEPGG